MARKRSELSGAADNVAEFDRAAAIVEQMVTSPNAAPPAAPSATGLPVPQMGAGYERITERVFDLPDPDGLFNELMDEIEIKEALTPEVLKAAANRCEKRAIDAHQLYVCAKVEHDRYEAQMARVTGAMREAATAELQQEKDGGKRAKTITNADVEARAAHMFPDEWTDAITRESRAKRMIDQLERISTSWQFRSKTIAAILGSH